MFFLISKGIREFCEAMVASPNDWVQGPYAFCNKKHPDLSIWTANGLFFIKIGGNNGLTLAEKRHVIDSINLTSARKLKGGAA